MVAKLNLLTAKQASSAGPGKHNDGGGLYLYKLANGAPQWVFRFTYAGKRREMGLGGYHAVSLGDARRMAERHRAIVQGGGNPIEVRKEEQRSALASAAAADPKERERKLLRTIAPLAFEARKPQLRDGGKAGRWYSPVQLHILPTLGQKPVDEITATDIQMTLAPIWYKQPDVARKAITRLDICLRYARARGLDADRNAVADARELLGKQVHNAQHIPSMDWREVPAFYKSLEGGDVVHMALQLLILTALRSKAVRFAHVDQISGNVWTVPADLVKGQKGKTSAFRVPLPEAALEVVERAKTVSRDGFLFPGVRKGVISDASMARHMERMGLEARPHGFRSSFRTWADEATNAAYEVKEAAIGHAVGSAVSRAYARGDMLEERAGLSERWAAYVSGRIADVVPLQHY
jgi:integrase